MEQIFKKKQEAYQIKFYELTYMIEHKQQKRLSEIAGKFKEMNGWNEKEMLQFAVTATNQTDLEAKMSFLEGIIADWEKERKTPK